jgi:hypothetical protein
MKFGFLAVLKAPTELARALSKNLAQLSTDIIFDWNRMNTSLLYEYIIFGKNFHPGPLAYINCNSIMIFHFFI